jgi:hypothetical protein
MPSKKARSKQRNKQQRKQQQQQEGGGQPPPKQPRQRQRQHGDDEEWMHGLDPRDVFHAAMQGGHIHDAPPELTPQRKKTLMEEGGVDFANPAWLERANNPAC